MGRDAYVEVRPGENGVWTFRRRAGNHRPGKESTGYQRRASAVRAATAEFPDLEIRVFDRQGRLDRLVSPDY
jgi:uncharacterized protein YegP (UPF0339 family)